MPAIPKFRPAISYEQVLVLLKAANKYMVQENELEQTEYAALDNFIKSATLFLTKIDIGAKVPAYVQTKETPRKVTLADLGATEEDINKVTYSTIEDCQKAFVSLHTVYKPMGFPAPADLLGACQAWLSYCKENDLDPFKEAGLEETREN